MSIGSRMGQRHDEPLERVVVWQGDKYKRPDGVLSCTLEELEHWGDALDGSVVRLFSALD